MRLSEYEIAENKEQVHWKFKSEKKTGCDGKCCIVPGDLGSFKWASSPFISACFS